MRYVVRRMVWGLVFGVMVAAFTGCPQGVPQTDAALRAAYTEAVANAAVAESQEIYKGLTSITADTRGLVWEGEPGQSRVLMVTWTSWTGYDDQVGKSFCITDDGKSLATTRDTWVTPAPQAKTFGRALCGMSLAQRVLRIEQLLGLPPHNGKTRFVEFWVDPRDLFRPSPDPGIEDHEAELDFSVSPFVTINEEYKTWFNDLKSQSYGAGGYPWTRLGYTYDWGNPWCSVGLSEFVIQQGAEITVKGVSLNGSYLMPGS